MPAQGTEEYIRDVANFLLKTVEDAMERDCIAIFGPIRIGVDDFVRAAVEPLPGPRRDRVAVVLETPGGSAEVVERIVETLRHFYKDLAVVVPNYAMSAGTLLAMAGDSILMDFYGRLGPIDPQVLRGEKWVPALSYLIQYERLLEKDRKGDLTSAEFALLAKIDLAELHMFEQQRDLSVTLLRKWLTNYKFKDWVETETRKLPVDAAMRERRAEEVAKLLNNNEKWHSHGRHISRETLASEVKIRIDKLEENPTVAGAVSSYHSFVQDLITKKGFVHFVHSRAFY